MYSRVICPYYVLCLHCKALRKAMYKRYINSIIIIIIIIMFFTLPTVPRPQDCRVGNLRSGSIFVSLWKLAVAVRENVRELLKLGLISGYRVGEPVTSSPSRVSLACSLDRSQVTCSPERQSWRTASNLKQSRCSRACISLKMPATQAILSEWSTSEENDLTFFSCGSIHYLN